MLHLSNTSNQVFNQTTEGAELCNMFTTALPDLEKDLVAIAALLDLNVHVHMANILCELSARALDGDETRLDRNGHSLRNVKLFGLEDIAHLYFVDESVSDASLYKAAARKSSAGPSCIQPVECAERHSK
jgi:hypothetical protein